MKGLRSYWAGWVAAAIVLAISVGNTVYAQSTTPPTIPTGIDAHLVIQSDGTFYLYHDGVKFELPLADMSDVQVRALPNATTAQWDEHFGGPVAPAPEPTQVPGYS